MNVDCRFLIVRTGWQGAAEDFLIELFSPVWNNETGICYEFGKHEDSAVISRSVKQVLISFLNKLSQFLRGLSIYVESRCEEAGNFWVGADPGGIGNFGLAFLCEDGGVECATVSSVKEAIEKIEQKGNPLGLGIDAPMWWSSKEGGGRKVDKRLRKAYGLHPGTVQSVNSLQGAVLAGGALLAFETRQKHSTIRITESHPKALLKACYDDDWEKFANKYKISDGCCGNEHERDAIISAICAREGFEKRWNIDLSQDRYQTEQNPEKYWLAPINYFWPEQPE